MDFQWGFIYVTAPERKSREMPNWPQQESCMGLKTLWSERPAQRIDNPPLLSLMSASIPERAKIHGWAWLRFSNTPKALIISRKHLWPRLLYGECRFRPFPPEVLHHIISSFLVSINGPWQEDKKKSENLIPGCVYLMLTGNRLYSDQTYIIATSLCCAMWSF